MSELAIALRGQGNKSDSPTNTPDLKQSRKEQKDGANLRSREGVSFPPRSHATSNQKQSADSLQPQSYPLEWTISSSYPVQKTSLDLAADEFGKARVTIIGADIQVGSSLTSTGSLPVLVHIDQEIRWDARSDIGPTGQLDIENEDDRDITANNYTKVIEDLTPDGAGIPLRENFWAEDITIQHELFHVEQFKSVIVTGLNNIRTNLQNTSASNSQQIYGLIGQAVRTHLIGEFENLINSPQFEGDAYLDGKDEYEDRVQKINAKGNAGDYD